MTQKTQGRRHRHQAASRVVPGVAARDAARAGAISELARHALVIAGYEKRGWISSGVANAATNTLRAIGTDANWRISQARMIAGRARNQYFRAMAREHREKRLRERAAKDAVAT